MFRLIRFFLFLLPAETAHYFTLKILDFLIRIPLLSHLIASAFRHKSSQSVHFAGLLFPNNIGLAAGFDKNARYLKIMKMLGFGHVEIGTVTPKPQDGNEKPRLFRLRKDKAIINRMGFNNDGVDAIVEKLKYRPAGLVVGGNIGKNKVTPNEKASEDYCICFEKMYDHVDYFTVNVSSPNTPGLRELQDRGPLTNILNLILEIRKKFISEGKPKLPVFLKIAPDLSDAQLDDIVSLTLETGIDGIVATNTTLSREDLISSETEVSAIGAGGLSGQPVFKRSTEVLKYLNDKFEGKIPLIGVGGIMSKDDAMEKFRNGAGLVQIYTGFIYKGPRLIKHIA